jgi:hypothetical protein
MKTNNTCRISGIMTHLFIGWGWWNKFSILSNKKEKRKKNYILIIPLSDWTIIYFASILEIQLFHQFLLSEVVAPLTPVVYVC